MVWMVPSPILSAVYIGDLKRALPIPHMPDTAIALDAESP